MNLHIQNKSSEPIYEQIANQIRAEIIKGVLKEGEALPSIRGLAADLKISVITTKRAYEELEKEGLIYSVSGKGFYVDNPDLEFIKEKETLTLEHELADWVFKAREAGLSKKDALEMLNILMEE